MSVNSINQIIKSDKSECFRRAFIKRRSIVTGQFESSWYDVSDNIKKYGKISVKADDLKLNKFTFSNAKLVCDNEDGLFNPHTSESSLWNGYLNQQRTLVKYEAGFIERTKDSNGVWTNTEWLASSLWDQAVWDQSGSIWDGVGTSLFYGVISGDIPLSDSNEVTFNIKPLVSIFQDYPARNLTGWTSTGLTATQFVQMVMNQTDGSSNYIFLPFFGNTSTGYELSTTSNIYTTLNTSGAVGVLDKTVWQVIEKLAEAESYIPYINKQGVFKFVSRDVNTSTVAFEFHGTGSHSGAYGHTIKKISNYGSKQSKFYSRVETKFIDADTITSFVVSEGSFTVSPGSSAWVLGVRTLKVENFFIPNTATASAITTDLFNEYSALKNEIEFTTSFIPQLDLLDRVSIYYDPSEVNNRNLWDQNNWAADDTSTSLDLIFDASSGDAIKLNGEEFKFLSIEIDLDNLECKYLAREI